MKAASCFIKYLLNHSFISHRKQNKKKNKRNLDLEFSIERALPLVSHQFTTLYLPQVSHPPHLSIPNPSLITTSSFLPSHKCPLSLESWVAI